MSIVRLYNCPYFIDGECSLCEDAHLLNYLNVDCLVEQTESLHCLNREFCCIDVDMDIWAGKEIELLCMIISVCKKRKCGGNEITDVVEQMLGGLDFMGTICMTTEQFGEEKQRAREEVWDLAQRINLLPDIKKGAYGIDDLGEAFGTCDWSKVLLMPVEEALKKDKAYQEDKKALHIGDEVEFVGFTNSNSLMRGYVMSLDAPGDRCVVILQEKGSYHKRPDECKKTGKHNPDVEKVMASFEKGEKE